MTIVILVKHYLPGFKSGGPIRSLANLVDHLGDEFQFVVITSDRDSGDRLPYPGIRHGIAQRVGKAEVIYLGPAAFQTAELRRTLRTVRPDVLYLNSFFARRFAMLPVAWHQLRAASPWSIILAPRGEFSPGALRLNPLRKRGFLALSNTLGLHRGITWQASSDLEAADIRRCIRSTIPSRGRLADAILVAPDPLPPNGGVPLPRAEKHSGHLRILFLSRIVAKKNLLGAIDILAGTRGSVTLTICGPIEQPAYWSRCQRALAQLPPNVQVRSIPPVEHAGVAELMAQHDLFLLPTLGENYGHVVAEALQGGCLPLISDQTPWRGLQHAGIGWDLPLDTPDAFRAVIQECIAMNGAQFRSYSTRATVYARERVADASVIDANRALFHSVVSRSAAHAPRSVADRAVTT